VEDLCELRGVYNCNKRKGFCQNIGESDSDYRDFLMNREDLPAKVV